MIIQKFKRSLIFYSLSTIIPWLLWFSAAYISHNMTDEKGSELLLSLLSFTGLTAPLIIALFLLFGNEELKKDLLTRFFNFKSIKPQYLLLTVFLMPVSILAAQTVSLLFGYDIQQFHITGTYTFTSGIFPVWFLLLIAPLIEELAWHSYGTDSLRAKFNLFKTSMIFALFWGIWHFPLSFIKDYYHSNLAEEGWIYSMNFFLSLFPFVIIMNWLYYKTNRNILVTVIFHITAGYFNEIFATNPMSKVIQTFLLLALAISLIIKDKEYFFKQTHKIY